LDVSLQRRVQWLTDVMNAVRYLHERKVLRRDIKCDNVLLRKDMTALLGDFGLSKLLSSGRQEACSSSVGPQGGLVW
jgi:serine/threonine protein kinase